MPEAARAPIAYEIDAVLDLARRNSPTIEAARLSEQSAQITALSEQRKFLPTITLSAAARSLRDSSPTIDRDEDLSIGINFTMPLYTGGQGNSQTRQAVAGFNAARYTTENTIRQTDLQINQLWSQLQNGKAVLEAQLLNVEANREALEGITRGEAVGLSNTQDILEAQQNKLAAELAYSRALFGQYSTRLILKLNIGEFDVYDF